MEKGTRVAVGYRQLAELASPRDPLNAGLSGAPRRGGKEEGPNISERAGRIKAIESAQSVEAAPNCVRQKQSWA
jgi:hypothetical protein